MTAKAPEKLVRPDRWASHRGIGLPPRLQPKKNLSNGWPCPICGGGTQVTDSRVKGAFVKRRRVCPSCGVRHTTWEGAGDFNMPLSGNEAIRHTVKRLTDLLAELSLAVTPEAGEAE